MKIRNGFAYVAISIVESTTTQLVGRYVGAKHDTSRARCSFSPYHYRARRDEGCRRLKMLVTNDVKIIILIYDTAYANFAMKRLL